MDRHFRKSIGARGARANAEPPRAHPTSCVQETQDTPHVLPHSPYVRIVHMDYDLQEMENAERCQIFALIPVFSSLLGGFEQSLGFHSWKSAE